MGKGSGRRREDADRVRANWDVIFGPRIRVSPTPQTEREVPAPRVFPWLSCGDAGCSLCGEHLTDQ